MESGEHAGHVQASNVTKVCKLPCMHNLFLHIPTDLFDEFGHVWKIEVLLNPKPGPVQPAPPLSIQANSEYLILKWTSRDGVSIIISQKYSFTNTSTTTALRLAIYTWAGTKNAVTRPQ